MNSTKETYSSGLFGEFKLLSLNLQLVVLILSIPHSEQYQFMLNQHCKSIQKFSFIWNVCNLYCRRETNCIELQTFCFKTKQKSDRKSCFKSIASIRSVVKTVQYPNDSWIYFTLSERKLVDSENKHFMVKWQQLTPLKTTKSNGQLRAISELMLLNNENSMAKVTRKTLSLILLTRVEHTEFSNKHTHTRMLCLCRCLCMVCTCESAVDVEQQSFQTWNTNYNIIFVSFCSVLEWWQAKKNQNKRKVQFHQSNRHHANVHDRENESLIGFRASKEGKKAVCCQRETARIDNAAQNRVLFAWNNDIITLLISIAKMQNRRRMRTKWNWSTEK